MLVTNYKFLDIFNAITEAMQRLKLQISEKANNWNLSKQNLHYKIVFLDKFLTRKRNAYLHDETL